VIKRYSILTIITGDVHTFTAPADGVYTLEAWGASGGDGYDDSVDRETTSSVAGNGGYSKGISA